MTVVFSNFGDKDTLALKNMWAGLDAKVIELDGRCAISRDELIKMVEQEEDTVLFCGHGSDMGCFAPGLGFTFDSRLIPHIKAKNIIGIWCYAASFAALNRVPGFFSSMFISNSLEAAFVGVHTSGDKEIYDAEILFCDRVNELLKNKVPLSEWKEKLVSQMNNEPHNAVEEYNYNGLYFSA